MSSAILSFGRYIPSQRIASSVIAANWKRGTEQAEALGIVEKSVPNHDENTFTISWEAAEQALVTGAIDRSMIEAIFVGSESHPYAVKPTSGMLVSALNVNPFSHAADLEFACKAGTAALQIVDSMVRSKQVKAGIAIGADTAQSKPGDALEYSAAAGGAAFVVGRTSKKHPGICSIDATISYTTDTPDFWRGARDEYPSHAGRFTGGPGYFHHVETTAKKILEVEQINIAQIDHVVLHMPNAKFPEQAAKKLGISKEQLSLGFIVPYVGNTYAGCSPLGLTFVLEQAKKGQRILLVSYGSGAGSDAFLFTMLQDGVPLPKRPSDTTKYLTYAEYQSMSTGH